jgi:SAM-dependent methyltransferase
VSPRGIGPPILKDHERWLEDPNDALFKRIAATILQESSVLDVGCGRGDFLRFLRRTRPDPRVAGIDVTVNEGAEGIQFFQGDFFQSEIGGPFDFGPIGGYRARAGT